MANGAVKKRSEELNRDPALPPVGGENPGTQDLLATERENVATPNRTAAGATPRTGPVTPDDLVPEGFGTDVSGRIFKLEPDATADITPETEGGPQEPPVGEGPSGDLSIPEAPRGDDIFGGGGELDTGVLEPPDVPEGPDTSEIDAELRAAREGLPTAEQIEADLQQNLGAIDQKFAVREREMREDLENRKQNEFSDLAGIGTGINPLSSAGRSIQSAADRRLDRFLANERALKSAEKARARAAARGEKTEAAARQIELLKDERQNLIDEENERYDRLRNKFADTVTALNTSAQLARDKQDFDQTERENAVSNINTMFELMGSKAFENVDQEDKLALERAAGMPAGSLDVASERLRKEELAPDDLELRTIGGELFQVTVDEEGNAVTRLVQGKRRTGGTGGGGGTGTGDGTPPEISYDEFVRQLGQETNQSIDPTNQTVRDLYDEFLAAQGGGTGGGMADDEVLDLLTRTDKKQMLAQGLDPKNAADARLFIQQSEADTPSGGGGSDEFEPVF